MAFLDPLDEEETADYSDWRSIPDPPAAALSTNPAPTSAAPTSATAADDPAVEEEGGAEGNGEPSEEGPAAEEAMAEGLRRNRKRPPAFRDVTNRQGGGRDKKRAATAGDNSAEAADNNSVATANPSADSAATADPFAFAAAADSSAAAAAELWGGHGGEQRRRKRRRRQRRSLVLPPELSPPLDEGGGATHGPAAEPSIAIGGGKSAEGVDAVGKETLLQLVRAYTALPPDLRSASAAAAQLEALASYPLPGKRRPVLGHSASREEFLLRVQPIVTEMEQRKKMDAEEARAATRCEVRKEGRGYGYFDVESGERVGAGEYARRYGAMVAGRRRERIDRLGKEGGQGEASEGDATDESARLASADESDRNAVGEPDVEAKPSAKSDESSVDMDESVNMDESRMSLDGSAVREDEEDRASFAERASALEAEDHEAGNRLDEPRGETHGEASDNRPEPPERNERQCQRAHPPLAGMPPSDDPRRAVKATSFSLRLPINTMSSPPFIARRALPSCGPLSSSKSSRVEISRKFTRDELKESVKRNTPKDILAMSASRKRNALAAQNQRSVQQHGAESPDTTAQLRSLDMGVKLCARKYNEAKAQANRLEEEVKSRGDGLAALEREATALREMLDGNNADALTISRLSAEIQEANECAETTLLYRHSLDHMQQRLGKNSVALDGHLGEMAATLAAAQKERDRSQKMLAELESGLTFASIELDDTIRDTRMAEDERARELSEKQLEASDAGRMEEFNRERTDRNHAVHMSLADSGRLDRERLQRTVRERKAALRELRGSAQETAAKLGSFEESFAHVKQATGVNSLSEMVRKLTDHDASNRQLLAEKKDAEERQKAARAALSKDQETLAELKTAGMNQATELNRETLEGLKGSTAQEKTECKVLQSTNERLEGLLVGLRQGGIGLYNRLLPFHSTLLSGEAPKLGEIDATDAIQAAADTLEMISFTEKILGRMLIDIGGIGCVDAASDDGVSGKESTGPESPTERLNLRVKPRPPTAGPRADDNDETDSDEGIPSRTKLKTTSELTVVESQASAEEKRGGRRKLKASPSAQQRAGEATKQPASPATPNSFRSLASPPGSRRSHSAREDPIERIDFFLSELPLE
ncbi:hypothetical protein ACHAXT_003879 [Thalassiosira profunda]